MQLKKKYKTVLARLKNKLFGRKRYHLIEPYTVWVDRMIDDEVVSYRKVYYYYGRKNSPFHRKYGKGIQVSGHGIQGYETIEAYIDDLKFTKYTDTLSQVTLACA
ncbi:hypothetical protein BIZ83_gp206 [Erwinia phage vB_EamM_ChrisDB]|uniref:hypothetical protein n=1 Tax=Erwinia phage vB_EamM_ChrisDB TaxID=1883371 RepID=UPI00081CDA5C|nr:hypothetical protein BIZ83_gp206 [Erwinia phage vB_EamM_ChrisDB]ANZ48647.1 hypothetical protein CHRISDB_85 [Erwinia phage vB_EamM_ChrisDB]